jgi:hypothetical protein
MVPRQHPTSPPDAPHAHPFRIDLTLSRGGERVNRRGSSVIPVANSGPRLPEGAKESPTTWTARRCTQLVCATSRRLEATVGRRRARQSAGGRLSGSASGARLRSRERQSPEHAHASGLLDGEFLNRPACATAIRALVRLLASLQLALDVASDAQLLDTLLATPVALGAQPAEDARLLAV